MPELNNSQAATEEISEEAQVQETAAPEETSTQTEPQTEKPLTTEDYRRIAREEATRVAQSQVAKSENRTDRRIQERFAALEANKSVLKLSDEQVLEVRRQIIEEEQMNSFANPNEQQSSGFRQAQPSGSEGQAPEADPIRMLNGLIGAVFQTVGTAVTANDPEHVKLQKVIDKAWTINGPEGLAMVQIAAADCAREKAARVNAQRQNAAGRVMGTSGAPTSPNDISNITDSKELYRMGEEKFNKK